MTVRKIFFGLVLLSAIGLFGLARWDDQRGRTGVTDIKPTATEAHQSPIRIEPLKIEAPPTHIESSGAETRLILDRQPVPTMIEPLKIERFSTPIQPLSAEIKPLKIEPHITTIGSPAFTAPRIVEPMTIVENPLPKPTQLPGDDLRDAMKQREMMKEVEQELQKLKQLDEIKNAPMRQMRQEQLRVPVGRSPVLYMPRRP